MKLKFIQSIIDRIRVEFEYRSSVPYKLFYIGSAKHNNAGDMFNINVMQYFGLPFMKARVSAANLLNIGSIIDKIFLSEAKCTNPIEKECTIIGSGLMHEPSDNEKIIKNVKILALRGNLTKGAMEKLLNKEINCPLADPGLLAPCIIPIENKNKKYKAGIIPHYVDKKSPYLKNIQCQNYKIIDIEQDIKTLFEEINECECILSSSLHGLIFADSFGIPNRHLLIADKLVGESFKFRDYYSSYNVPQVEAFDLRCGVITEEVVESTIEFYSRYTQEKQKEIAAKQKELIEIYKNLNHSKEN